MSRVLLHSLVFAPDSVSTAYLMTDLALELTKLGHQVTVLTTTPHYKLDDGAAARQTMRPQWGGLVYHSECSGIPVWHVKLPMKGERVWARAVDYVRFHIVSLMLAASSIGPQDIVIATSPPLTIGVMSWLFGLRFGAPSVYKVAEIYPDIAIDQGVVKNATFIRALKLLERFVYSANTKVVPIARQFADVIRDRGVPERKLEVITDFVDIDLYKPVERDPSLEAALGLPEGFRVLYAGNIGLVQDWDSVLHAAGALSDIPVRFVIVGEGGRRSWLEAEIASRKLHNVVLLPYQPKELIPKLTALCDVAIIPMTHTGSRGGFPSKIFTLLASAKPAVASAEPGSEMEWIVAQSGCGRTVPPEDPQAFAKALRTAYEERRLLPAEGARGRAFVESFSKEAVARRYDALIRNLISRRRRDALPVE